MGTIKELTAVFCAACVLSGGLRLLIGSELESSARYILALVLLTVTVTSATGVTISMPAVLQTAAVDMDTGAEELSRYEAEYLAGRALAESGVEYTEIRAKVTKRPDGGIGISEIEVKGASDPKMAEQILLDTGLTDRVLWR